MLQFIMGLMVGFIVVFIFVLLSVLWLIFTMSSRAEKKQEQLYMAAENKREFK